MHCNKYHFVLHFLFAITTCCVQFCVVACAARPPTSQQQHYLHTNITSSSSKPILFISTETTTTTDRRACYGYPYSISYVAIVKASKIVPQERISERICEQVVDVSFPQVVEQREMSRTRVRCNKPVESSMDWPRLVHLSAGVSARWRGHPTLRGAGTDIEASLKNDVKKPLLVPMLRLLLA